MGVSPAPRHAASEQVASPHVPWSLVGSSVHPNTTRWTRRTTGLRPSAWQRLAASALADDVAGGPRAPQTQRPKDNQPPQMCKEGLVLTQTRGLKTVCQRMGERGAKAKRVVADRAPQVAQAQACAPPRGDTYFA